LRRLPVVLPARAEPAVSKKKGGVVCGETPQTTPTPPYPLHLSLRALILFSLLACFLVPVSGPRAAPGAAAEYLETFVSNQYKAYAENVEWNTANHQAALLKDSGGWYTEPEIQPDGTGGSYVVWADIRNNNRDGNWDIYAQRLDARGNRLWPQDLRVDSDSKRRFQRTPQSAVDSGGNLVVAWKDARDDTYLSIYAQKVTAAGQKLWPGDALVNGKPAYPVRWEFGGTLALGIDTANQVWVAWVGSRVNDWSMPEILAQKLSPTGARLWAQDAPAGQLYSGNRQTGVTLAVGAPNSALVAWVDERNGGEDIYAGLLDAAGSPLWPADVAVSAGSGVSQQGSLRATLDMAGSAIVVWRQGAPNKPVGAEGNTILAQKVSPAGQLLWSGNVAVNRPTQPVYRGFPRVAVTPQGAALVVWVDDRKGYSASNVFGQLLSPLGAAQWAADRELSPADWWGQELGGVVIRGSTAFLAWQRWGDVYMQLFDLASSILVIPVPPQVNESDGKAGQYDLDLVARADGGALAVWVDDRRFGNDIRAEAFHADGTPAWNRSILVNEPDGGDEYKPQAVTNAHAKTLVIWNQDAKLGIEGQLLDDNGLRLVAGDIKVNADARMGSFGAVAALPDGSFVVAWPARRDPTREEWDIYLQRIDEQGQRLWPADRRVNRGDYTISLVQVDTRSRPALAVDAQGQIVVAWRGETPAAVNVYLQRVSPAGTALWAADLALGAHLDPAGAGGEAVCALLAGDGITAAWKSDTAGDWGLFVRQFSLDGAPAWDALRVSVAQADVFYGNPDLNSAPNGDVLLAWDDEHQDGRNVYAQLVSPQGGPRWAQPAQLNEFFSWATHPAAAWLSGGAFLVAWHDARFGDPDLFARPVTLAGAVLWNADMPLREQQPAEQFYQPVGTVASLPVNAGNLVGQATLFADQVLQGGAVQYFLSSTGGKTWQAVIPGEKNVFPAAGTDLRWKAVLTATLDSLRTPQINQVRIVYSGPAAGDIFEPDDTCAAARKISVDGMPQQHTFDPPGDSDWAYFSATAGETYILQVQHTGPKADVLLDVYASCSGAPVGQGRNNLGSDLRFSWRAPADGPVFVHLYNTDPAQGGADADYDFSVWSGIPLQWPVAIIVAGHDDNFSRQAQINNSADFAYTTLVKRLKIPKSRVRYFGSAPNRDVDGNGLADDIAGLPLPAALQQSIQAWVLVQSAAPQAALPFYLYLVDHGSVDRMQISGSGGANAITARNLGLWLDNLEAQIRVDANVIIDTCYSGSFIDKTPAGPASLSGLNRVIITSTTSDRDAYVLSGGTLFSDAFWSALGSNRDLESAFQFARSFVRSSDPGQGTWQEPWLDDNGDAAADGLDGSLARSRGLGALAAAETIPVIDAAEVAFSAGGSVTVTVRARDDKSIAQVRVLSFPAKFQPPAPAGSGVLPDLPAAVQQLAPQGSAVFSAVLALSQPGGYRLVFYAVDVDGNPSQPVVRWIYPTYLPAVVRR